MIKKLDIFEDLENNCVQIRNNYEHFTLEFNDHEKKEIFFKIVEIYKATKKVSFKSLRTQLKNFDEAKVLTIIQDLSEYELINLEKGNEGKKISATKKSNYAILGTGRIPKVLKKELSSSFRTFHFFDLKEKQSIDKIIKNSNFVIVDANEWNPTLLDEINKNCLKNTKPWLLINGIEGDFIKIGPLFIGENTGCYECLISRSISNDEYPSLKNSYRNHLSEKKSFSKPDLNNNSVMLKLIANFILLEIDKWEYHTHIPSTFKKQVVLDVANFEIESHSLLKKPYCEVCNPQLSYHTAPFLEPVTLK